MDRDGRDERTVELGAEDARSGEERSVPADWRDDGSAELTREDAELAMTDGELAAAAARSAQVEAQVLELAELEVTLERLRQLRDRVEQRQLEADDWALIAALVREEM